MYENLDFYVGSFKNDLREGYGKMFYAANGEVSEAMWKADKREGKGTLKFYNGDFYEGNFEEDKI